MGKFDKGVSYYTIGTAHIKVSFPEDSIICQHCVYCRPEKELGRYFCRLTNDMLYSPFSTVGARCPIVFEEGDG